MPSVIHSQAVIGKMIGRVRAKVIRYTDQRVSIEFRSKEGKLVRAIRSSDSLMPDRCLDFAAVIHKLHFDAVKFRQH